MRPLSYLLLLALLALSPALLTGCDAGGPDEGAVAPAPTTSEAKASFIDPDPCGFELSGPMTLEVGDTAAYFIVAPKIDCQNQPVVSIDEVTWFTSSNAPFTLGRRNLSGVIVQATREGQGSLAATITYTYDPSRPGLNDGLQNTATVVKEITVVGPPEPQFEVTATPTTQGVEIDWTKEGIQPAGPFTACIEREARPSNPLPTDLEPIPCQTVSGLTGSAFDHELVAGSNGYLVRYVVTISDNGQTVESSGSSYVEVNTLD